MFFLEQLACMCSFLACILQSGELNDLAQLLHCLADFVYCSYVVTLTRPHALLSLLVFSAFFGPHCRLRLNHSDILLVAPPQLLVVVLHLSEAPPFVLVFLVLCVLHCVSFGCAAMMNVHCRVEWWSL